MIKFEKIGERVPGRDSRPIIEVDAAREGGKPGFQVSKAAARLLNINLDRTNKVVLTSEANRLFGTVRPADERFRNAFVVGKGGRGSNKDAWNLVTALPFVGKNGAKLLVAQIVENAETDVDSDVFELVALYPEAGNTTEDSYEAEASDWADARINEVEETVDFNGF